jgi:hypothetical protein
MSANRTPMLRLSTLAPVALLASLALLAGCKTAPKVADRHEVQRESVRELAIAMPSGVDRGAAELIEQGRRFSIYVELLGIDDPKDKKLLFPQAMASRLGITNTQMRRRFMDAVMTSRRFEVYDNTSSVTSDKSDYVVDGMVTQVTQEIVPIEGGMRVARTRVELSLQGKQRYDGDPMFVGGMVVTGQTGTSSGDRVVLAPSDRLDNPQVQERIGVDYERALRRALNEAAAKISDVVRPMGKVVSIDGDQIGMLGGQAHGFQGKDEVVVFRATTIRLPTGKEEFSSTRPVAVARCDGAGTRTSQCVVIRRAPGMTIQVGDLTVLSDFSAGGTRVQ